MRLNAVSNKVSNRRGMYGYCGLGDDWATTQAKKGATARSIVSKSNLDDKLKNAAAAIIQKYVSGVQSGAIRQKGANLFFKDLGRVSAMPGLTLAQTREAYRIAETAFSGGYVNKPTAQPERNAIAAQAAQSARDLKDTPGEIMAMGFTPLPVPFPTGMKWAKGPALKPEQKAQLPTPQPTPQPSTPVAVTPTPTPAQQPQQDQGVLDRIGSGLDNLADLITRGQQTGQQIEDIRDSLRRPGPSGNYDYYPDSAGGSVTVAAGGGGTPTSFWDGWFGGETQQPEELNKGLDTNTLLMLGAGALALVLLAKK